MKRAAQLCFTLLFLAVLFAVPLLILLRGAHIHASVHENRTLAQIPVLSKEALLDGSYFSAWDTWLTDHIGGRERLMAWNTWLDYRLLGRPVVNDVVVDSEVLLPFQTYGTWDLSYLEGSAARVCDGLSSLEEAVSAYGGQFYYLGVPLQSSFYYDRYPSYLENRRWHVEAMTAAFSHAMEERGLTFLDLEPVYRSAESEQPLYAASDHHYTYYGAYLAYRTFLDRVRTDTGWDLPVLEEQDLTFQALDAPFLGSRNRKLYGLWTGSESAVIGIQRDPVPFTRTDNGAAVPATLYTLPEEGSVVDYNIYMGGDIAETVLQTDRPELPDLLIFGDSFTNPLETLLYTGFNETRCLDLRYYQGSLLDYVRTYQPDVVLCVRDDTAYLSPEGNGTIQ